MNVNTKETKLKIIQKLKNGSVEDFDRNILELVLEGLDVIEKDKLTATQSLLEFGVLAKYEIRFSKENEKLQ